MKTLFRSTGTLHWLEDAKGDSIPEQSVLAHPVTAHVKYELRPSPQQALFVDLYAGASWDSARPGTVFELDNGIVLTGRIVGGALGGRANESVQKVKMIDVEESTIQIDQGSGNSSSPRDRRRSFCRRLKRSSRQWLMHQWLGTSRTPVFVCRVPSTTWRT